MIPVHATTHVTLRPARLDDAQNLAALSIQVWLHTYATEGLRDTLSGFIFATFRPDIFRGWLADPDRAFLVAEVDHHLVGYAELAFDSRRTEVPGVATELATLYVQEHFGGKGIGSWLLEASAEAARAHCGDPAFWLSVYHRNEPALAFYRKHGFSERGDFDFELGDERHRNLILAR